MSIKRIIQLLSVLLIIFLLTACNSGEISSNTETSTTISEINSKETTDKNTVDSTNIREESENVQSDNNSERSKPSSSSNNNSSKNSVTSTATSTTVSNNYKQATDSDNNVTIANDGMVSITIPKWFLLKIEPNYNYKLTDQEVNEYKFKSVSKNSDGSATYKIGYNDYYGFLLISQSSVNSVVNKYKHNIWFSKIDVDAGYNNIKIFTQYNSLEDFDDDFDVYITLSGLQTTFYQYINYNYSVGTTITVYNKDNVVLATYKFPDLLK